MPGGLRLIDLDVAGWLYTPGSGGPFPGVLILHGGEGSMSGWAHRFAVILAAHGYAALAYPYAPGGDVFRAGPIENVPLERTADVFQRLRQHETCSGRAGIFGWSKGGEHTLLVSAEMARRGYGQVPDAIAAHAPFDVITPAFNPEALVPGGDPQKISRGTAWLWEGSDAGLAPSTRIAIEDYKGPVFMSVGLADEISDSSMTLRIADRLRAAGRAPDLMTVEGQGHAYDAKTEPLLWSRLDAFFKTHLVQA